MQYYINYKESANVDYCFLLALYSIAKKDKHNKLYSIVRFRSCNDLVKIMKEQVNYITSVTTISRKIKDKRYNDYFNYNADNKEIILYNNFKKDNAKSNKFIVITQQEKEFLLQQNDNLLCKYLLYIKYYCGRSKTKTTDFTAEQFFAAVGYSKKSGSYKSLLSSYNGILSARGFIKIDKYRENGKERNIYAL